MPPGAPSAPAPAAAAAPAAPVVVETSPARAPAKAVGGAKAAPPTAKPVATAPAGLAQPAPAAPASTSASAATSAPKPPLDLTSLEARLRETDAIGMFTKIALKNQVEDLLDQFREYYAGKVTTSLAELRPPYDRLLLKVLALLQDEDPELARAIVDSREPIWSILADRAKFATL
jgi:hypothetical protein